MLHFPDKYCFASVKQNLMSFFNTKMRVYFVLDTSVPPNLMIAPLAKYPSYGLSWSTSVAADVPVLTGIYQSTVPFLPDKCLAGSTPCVQIFKYLHARGYGLERSTRLQAFTISKYFLDPLWKGRGRRKKRGDGKEKRVGEEKGKEGVGKDGRRKMGGGGGWRTTFDIVP